METRYRRAAFVTAARAPDGTLAFRTPSRFVELAGADADPVHRLWNALATPAAAAEAARSAGLEIPDAEAYLEALRADGLVSARATPDAPASAYDELAPAGDAAAALARARVAVVGDPGLAREARAALADLGVRLEAHEARDPTAGPRILVALARADDVAPLREANASAAGDEGLALVVAEWRGLALRLGPTRRRAEDACWTCAEWRAWGNAASPDAHEGDRASRAPAEPQVPRAHAAIIAGAVASEVASIVLRGAGAWENAQMEVNLLDFTVSRAPLLPVPACPACALSAKRV